jgi:hypothetical protein
MVALLGAWKGVQGRLSQSKNFNATMHLPIENRSSSSTFNWNARGLFELPMPFESFNEQCERFCANHHQLAVAQVVEHLPMACPKCLEAYTPCNSCCYGGASSLKLRFFGCPGNLTFALHNQLVDNCVMSTSSSNDVLPSLTAVKFVDCECYDVITNLDDIDAALNASSSCLLYDSLPLSYDMMEVTVHYFDICLVSASRTDITEDFILDLLAPLPDVVGIQHDPYFHSVAGIDDSIFVHTTVTYFDTTCDLKVKGPHGNLSFPLFPGYGKFATTCPDKGFIDFGHSDITPLPDAIDHFDGIPPPTSFYYMFMDGTSVGFWPADLKSMDDNDIWFLPNMAKCSCRDCGDDNETPSTSPMGLPTAEYPGFKFHAHFVPECGALC